MSLRVALVAADPALTLDQAGGAGTHLRGTIAGLEAAGIEVEPYVGVVGGSSGRTTAAASRQLRSATPAPVRRVVRDVRLLRYGRRYPRMLAAGVDCVYERSSYLLDTGRRLAKEASVPWVLETDGMLVDARRDAYGAPLAIYAERLERRKLRGADALVVMAESQRQAIAERYGVPPERVFVKGLGVDGALVAGEPPPLPAEPVVGFAGTFQPYQGTELLAAAAARLGDSARFVFVGDGPRLAATRTLAPDARFTGRLSPEATLDELRSCRVLVVPDAARDLYPVKFLEYGALGRPVVCPALPAFEEFRGRGRPLVFEFEPGSVDGLVRAIQEALADRDAAARARELRDLVARGYTWTAVGARLAGLLHRVVGR